MYVGPEDYLDRLESVLTKHGDPERAQGQKRYMKEKFQFFGPSFLASLVRKTKWSRFKMRGICHSK